MFRFDSTNWAEPPLGQPAVAAGVQFVESWSGYAVFLGGDEPALLQFPALNPLGRANISPDSGCVRFWYSPAWASTNLGGSGPGTVARLRWPGPSSSPTKLIDDLSSYTLRPEGVDLMSVLGTPRVLFVEDRYQATGYGTRNAVHWPTNILGNIP